MTTAAVGMQGGGENGVGLEDMTCQVSGERETENEEKWGEGLDDNNSPSLSRGAVVRSGKQSQPGRGENDVHSSLPHPLRCCEDPLKFKTMKHMRTTSSLPPPSGSMWPQEMTTNA